jgi:catechol 2,3-dioxygenase
MMGRVTMTEQAFRAPADLLIGAVTLRVRDLSQMIQFYSSFLGLELLHESENYAALGFSTGQPLVNLQKLSHGIARPANSTGLYHFALLTASRQKLAHALHRLLQAGYPLQGVADHFVSEAIYLADPEGNGIEIYADRPRETWQREGDSIRMGTAALDVDTLLALVESPQELSPVLSAGTLMGHVHLQVRNLAEAMDFYEGMLGFDPMGLYGSSAAFYSAGGYHHHVGLNTWASADGPAARPDMLGLDQYEILYPEQKMIEALIESLTLAGTSYRDGEDGVVLEDPSGIRIKIRVERTHPHPF